MIYGITGLPGNGKTLYALYWVTQKAERENRQVWYHGISDLTLPWHKLPTQHETINGQSVEVPQWWTAPPNSIVIIDEAQNCGFGARPRGQVPEWARKLETHRHLGLDLVFITQSPMLLDSHDRALIGTHFHVVRNFGTQRATIHEFQQCRDDVLKRRTGSVRHEWKYPKEVFGWYKSAEAHTYKARIPARLWLLLVIPVVVAILAYALYARWKAKISANDPAPPSVTAPGSMASAPTATPPTATASNGKTTLTPAQYVEQFVPRVSGLAYTAPVYDAITVPTQAPYPAACIASKDRCQCYTQQGTRLQVGGDDLCRDIANGGFFVAWQAPGVAHVAQAYPVQGSAGTNGPVGSLGGNPRSHIIDAK